MPSVRELAKLFRAISARNLSDAEGIAESIAASERRKGHAQASQLLSGALNGKHFRGYGTPESLTAAVAQDLLSAALQPARTSKALSDVMLRASATSTVKEIIAETRHSKLLESKRLSRRTKLIFIGPPGCGKSLTARAIATELGIPLYVIRFDAIIGGYLGQTAANLRELFRFAAANMCVLLFDEVDALGKQRGSTTDVGELDRIVIAMMQELEFFTAPGLLIATSNLAGTLDRALWRRFDLTLEFPPPSRNEIRNYARRLAPTLGLKISEIPMTIDRAKSYADAEKQIESIARKKVLKSLDE